MNKNEITVNKQVWMALLKIERNARKFRDASNLGSDDWMEKADGLHDALEEFDKIKNNS